MKIVKPEDTDFEEIVEAVDMVQRLLAAGDMLRHAWSEHLCLPNDADLAERNRRFSECMKQSAEWGRLAQEACYRWGVVRGSTFYLVTNAQNNQNKVKRTKGHSAFKGVTYDMHGQRSESSE